MPEASSSALARALRLNRRQVIAAATGVAAAVALPAGSAAAAPGKDGLIPKNKRGIILYTVRDAIGRDPNTAPSTSAPAQSLQHARLGYQHLAAL